MKKNIFYLIVISAMFISSCRKIEMDGEKEVIIINGGGGSTTGQTITVSGRINADSTFRKANTYILKGLVYIVGNHTLTIEPGTVIKGAFSGTDVAALIITRGSKIMAAGTENRFSFGTCCHNFRSTCNNKCSHIGSAKCTFDNCSGLDSECMITYYI